MKRYKVILVDICFILIYHVDIRFCNEAHRSNRCTCRIPISNHRQTSYIEQPLLLQTGSIPKIVYPEIHDPSTIETKVGEAKVSLYCPTGSLTVRSTDQCIYLAHLVCLNKTTFQLSNSQRAYLRDVNSINEISCTKEPQPSAKLLNNRHYVCPAGTCVEIGFQLNAYDFIPAIHYIVVDVAILQPLVAHIHMIPVIKNRQAGRNAWTFRRGPVFQNARINFSEIYRRNYQRKRFLEIFSDPQVANRYIPEIGDAYLAEGQLVTERDFFYKTEQASAYFYENIVPIWRNIAVGNWHLVGEVVRNMAEGTTTGLKVWSGVIGVLTLPDYRGGNRRIFLVEEGRSHVIPIPKILFKYVYDSHQHCGLAILTINDPHLVHGVSRDLVLCPERSTCPSAHPQFSSIEKGFTYCCSPDGFARVAKALNLPVFSGACALI